MQIRLLDGGFEGIEWNARRPVSYFAYLGLETGGITAEAGGGICDTLNVTTETAVVFASCREELFHLSTSKDYS